ncbi:antirestriction protein ArdA [Pectinatus frisingensis]|uniref:antirestriction protein ArdA n=1 Tax=Pectinatus frisingensis TaxID=865 RepID=UPI0018C85E12|nr:antirestriction protein ArdA [Pectinatus frisingensis]
MELKIYLTNLGKYNEGELVGKWIDVLEQPDWQEELKSIGVADNTGYEDFFITDYETDIKGLKISEYESLQHLDDIAEQINSIEDCDHEAFNAACEAWGLSDALEAMQKEDYGFYLGISDDDELGHYLVDEGLFGVEVPEALENYLDYEAIGRDASMDGTYTENGYIERY